MSGYSYPKSAIKTFVDDDLFGAALFKRGENDPHVVIAIYNVVSSPGTEEDCWVLFRPIMSAFYISKLSPLLTEVENWIKENCEPDPSGYGWNFKDSI